MTGIFIQIEFQRGIGSINQAFRTIISLFIIVKRLFFQHFPFLLLFLNDTEVPVL